MSAQILLHPRLQQRETIGQIVRFFESRGYALSNTTRGRIVAHVRRQSVVESMFEFSRRPQ